MPHRVHTHINLIYSVGTQVVALREVLAQNGRTLHPRGAVGVVVKSPTDAYPQVTEIVGQDPPQYPDHDEDEDYEEEDDE